MTKIITRLELLFDFSWVASGLPDLHPEKTRFIGYYDNGAPAGLAILINHADFIEILQLLHKEGYTDSCADVLLGAACALAKDGGVPLSLAINVECNNYSRMEAHLLRKGFIRDTDKHAVICRCDKATQSKWNDFMEKTGSKVLARCKRKGYITLAYKDMTVSQRHYVCTAAQEEVGHPFSPGRERMPIEPRSCFFTFYDNVLAAFCVVLRSTPAHMLFEFIGANERHRGAGAAMPPLIHAITDSFHYGQTQNIAFIYNADNKDMTRLATRMLAPVIDTTKTRAYYRLLHP